MSLSLYSPKTDRKNDSTNNISLQGERGVQNSWKNPKNLSLKIGNSNVKMIQGNASAKSNNYLNIQKTYSISRASPTPLSFASQDTSAISHNDSSKKFASNSLSSFSTKNFSRVKNSQIKQPVDSSSVLSNKTNKHRKSQSIEQITPAKQTESKKAVKSSNSNRWFENVQCSTPLDSSKKAQRVGPYAYGFDECRSSVDDNSNDMLFVQLGQFYRKNISRNQQMIGVRKDAFSKTLQYIEVRKEREKEIDKRDSEAREKQLQNELEEQAKKQLFELQQQSSQIANNQNEDSISVASKVHLSDFPHPQNKHSVNLSEIPSVLLQVPPLLLNPNSSSSNANNNNINKSVMQSDIESIKGMSNALHIPLIDLNPSEGIQSSLVNLDDDLNVQNFKNGAHTPQQLLDQIRSETKCYFPESFNNLSTLNNNNNQQSSNKDNVPSKQQQFLSIPTTKLEQQDGQKSIKEQPSIVLNGNKIKSLSQFTVDMQSSQVRKPSKTMIQNFGSIGSQKMIKMNLSQSQRFSILQNSSKISLPSKLEIKMDSPKKMPTIQISQAFQKEKTQLLIEEKQSLKRVDESRSNIDEDESLNQNISEINEEKNMKSRLIEQILQNQSYNNLCIPDSIGQWIDIKGANQSIFQLFQDIENQEIQKLVKKANNSSKVQAGLKEFMKVKNYEEESERLKTFYKFGFNAQSKDDNVKLQNIVKEVIPSNEKGSLICNELWSDKHIKVILDRADFQKQRTLLQQYLVHKAELTSSKQKYSRRNINVSNHNNNNNNNNDNQAQQKEKVHKVGSVQKLNIIKQSVHQTPAVKNRLTHSLSCSADNKNSHNINSSNNNNNIYSSRVQQHEKMLFKDFIQYTQKVITFNDNEMKDINEQIKTIQNES